MAQQGARFLRKEEVAGSNPVDSTMSNLLGDVSRILFPTYCLICGKETHGELVCEECLREVKRTKGLRCVKCDLPLKSAPKDGMCKRCKRRKWSFSYNRSYGTYSGTLKKLLIELKYHDHPRLAVLFSSYLIKLIMDSDLNLNKSIITFVPLSNRAKRNRGYNQTYLMAREISKRLGIPCYSVLKFRRQPLEQINLSEEERLENMKDIFTVDKNYIVDVIGKNVILIDDVFTTGATVEGCSRALKTYGAQRVCSFTVARSKWQGNKR